MFAAITSDHQDLPLLVIGMRRDIHTADGEAQTQTDSMRASLEPRELWGLEGGRLDDLKG
jgi:hypothetical protein